MNKKQRQQALLAVLALVFLVVVGRQVGRMVMGGSEGGSTRRTSSTQAAGAEGWRDSLPVVEDLRLEDLEIGAEALDEGRDPFQLSRPEPPPPPRPSTADLRRAAEEAQKRRQEKVVQAPARPPRPMPPPVDVVYLGSFGSDKMRLAVFTDGNEIFNVPEGNVLKEKFVVVRIGFESADLGFVGFPEAPAQRLEIGG